MNTSYLFNKVSELTERFTNLFQHRKKLKALENFSHVETFKHANYLPLIRECMKCGFLEETEAEFLDHMLKKYELNYLDWSHRTRWLKGEIERLTADARSRENPFQMDMFERKEKTYNVPLELLAGMKAKQSGRYV